MDAGTSRPDSSHSASEWTARQYTADIFGAFVECFIGVEKSSNVRWAIAMTYPVVPRSPSTTAARQPTNQLSIRENAPL
jgi:hypothetical protein